MKPLMNKTAFSLALALFLPACMLVGGGETRYQLIAPQLEAPPSEAGAAFEGSLSIARPETDRTRDSTRILVRRDRTLLPWAGSAWIDRAPDLLQDLLVEYLDGRVATVGRYGSLPADYRLDLVMRRFEFVEQADELQAELVLVARLFDAGGELLDATTLTGRESGGGGSIDEAVSSMEAAIRAVFEKVADWLRPRLAAKTTASEGGTDQ